ncbi:MAG: adenylyl-sulfate kinase [Angustibacter sp.]
MTSTPHDHTLPHVRLDDLAVADLELALGGVRLPWRRLGGSLADGGRDDDGRPSPDADDSLTCEIAVSDADAAEALRRGGALLCDRELTPLARLTAPRAVAGGLAGAVTAVREREARLFGERRTASSSGEFAVAVVAGRPLLAGELESLCPTADDAGADAARALVLVPVESATRDGLDPATLMAAVESSLAAADVDTKLLPVAMAWRDARSDRALAAAVAARHGVERSVLLAEHEDWAGVLAAVRSGRTAPEVVTPGVADVLRRWHRPRHRRGLVVMLTGLSGSGKSTIARDLAQHVIERTPRTVSLLDGDDVRRLLSSGLGFDRESRDLNVRRIGFVAAEVARHGGVAVCAPIAPYAQSRAAVRQMVEAVGDFVLVHVSTPLEECERRDLKGLYAKARAGELPAFTGVSDPYEAPVDADLAIDTTTLSRADALQQVVDHLTHGGWLTDRGD